MNDDKIIKVFLLLLALFVTAAVVSEMVGYDIGTAKLKNAEQNATTAYNALANCEAAQQGGIIWESQAKNNSYNEPVR